MDEAALLAIAKALFDLGTQIYAAHKLDAEKIRAQLDQILSSYTPADFSKEDAKVDQALEQASKK